MTERAKSALGLHQRETTEITYEMDTSAGLSARGYDTAQVISPQERFKNVVEIISLAQKCSQASTKLKGIFSEKQQKRRKRKSEVHQEEKTREKDRWTVLMEAADREIKAKIAALVQSRQQEDCLKEKFAYQAELFRKSPIRDHTHLDKYREILDLPKREERKSPGKAIPRKREKSAMMTINRRGESS